MTTANATTTNSGIRTRVLILSDTHSALPDPINTPDLPYSHTFPSADLAIHCGDLTSTGKLHEHERALTLLKSLPARIKLVIPGNHDLTLDQDYCATHPHLYDWSRPHTKADLEAAHQLYTSPEARETFGIIYLTEGTHALTLPNGATLKIYASPYTPEFCDWAFAHPKHVDRFNAPNTTTNTNTTPTNPIPTFHPTSSSPSSSNIHILITHGPPHKILDLTTTNTAVGDTHLRTALLRAKPLLHCFGHIHESWGHQILHHNDTTTDNNTKTESKALDDEAISESSNLNTPIMNKIGECAYIDATALEHGIQTVCVNASIMSVEYEACQRGWVVDLMLPSTVQ